MNSLKLFLFAVGLSVVACTPPVRPCSSATCSTGCCDANGQCQSGNSVTACGAQGNECRTCSTTQTCNSGQCTMPNNMGGGGAGTAGGGSAVGGGQAGSMGGGAAGGQALTCANGLTLCGTSCINTATDYGNCGACGRSCGVGQYCSGSTCLNVPTSCTPGPNACPTNFFCDAITSKCVFGCQTNAHCSNGQICDTQRNTCACPTGSNLCGGSCVPANTPTACGSQCLSCSGGPNSIPSCTNGTCDFTCMAGYHRCGNSCVSNFDAMTCGTRCTACPALPNATAICDGNDCGSLCSQGFHQCGADCVSNFDVATCGNSCTPCQAPANAVAQCMSAGAGQPPACTFQCNPGFVRCGNACVAESITACGASCQTCTPPVGATNPQCVNGACQYTCAANFHQCGTQCVTNTAVATCGTLCTPCPAPVNGTATCNGTACGIQCNVGYHECNGQCVSNFSTSTCGSRCAPCPDGPVGSGTTVTCDGLNCGLRCASVSTPNYCGNVCVADSITSCGPSCQTCTPPANGTATCFSGVCDFTCQSGYHRCGTQCVADSSVDSCGTSCSACPAGPPNTTTTCTRATATAPYACGWDCGAGTNRCPAGGSQCVPSDYTLACGPTCAVCSSTVANERGICGTNGICSTGCITSCGGGCVNAQTNTTHCGTCNNTCAVADRCTQGECRTFCASGVGLSSMVPSVTTSTSTFPFLVIDVNGDGRNDLVTGEGTSVYVRLGLANSSGTGPSGTFGAPTSYSVSYTVAQLVAGDLTGDGRPEIVALTNSYYLSVLRNSGTGTFTAYLTSLSYTPTSATIGEFSGAAPADLFVSFNTTAVTAPLFVGNGAASGNPITTTATGGVGLGIGTVSNVRALSANADANSDVLATAATNAMYLYLGTGTATAPVNSAGAVLQQLPAGETFTSSAAGTAFMMEVADVTGDSIADVIVPVVSGATSGVRVYPLTSTPAFGTSTLLSLPAPARMIIASDVNGDGRRDVVVASSDVRVFLGQVGGTFSAAQVLGIPFAATFFNSLAVADVTGDSRPEIFAPSGTTIVTAVNNGSGGFTGITGTGVGNANRIAAGDLNGDGISDVVATGPGMLQYTGPDARLIDPVSLTAGTVRGRLEVLVNGVWGPVCAPSFPSSTTMSVACTSVGLSSWWNYFYATPSALPPVMKSPSCSTTTQTGLSVCSFVPPDTACTTANQLGIECQTSTTLNTDTSSTVLYGASNGTFTTGTTFPTRGDRFAIGNLNGDAPQDLVTAALGTFDGGMGNVIEVRVGATNSTLSPPLNLPARAVPTFILIAEVSNDANQDIVVGSSLGVDVYKNLGAATFAPPLTVYTGGVSSLAVADFNLDGRRDLVVATTAFNQLTPLMNVGLPGTAGFLAGTAIYPATATNFSVLAADVTYDGKPDLLFGRYVYQGNGSGAFTLYSSSMPIQPPRQVLLDLDNDGSLDLVGAGSASSVLSVLPGTSTTTFGFASTPNGYSSGAVVEDVVAAKMNADAQRDLIVLQGPSGSRSIIATPGVCR
ncbi:MAG: VCBS repeat-containing protein [Archangium sp.]|nr:VCBS repeat-containing protein [Archangium sp.]